MPGLRPRTEQVTARLRASLAAIGGLPGIGAAVAALYCLRVLGNGLRSHFPKAFPDSFSFTAVAAKGPAHPSFFWGKRPIGYTTLLWALGRSSAVNAIALTVLTCAGAGVLAATTWRTLRSRVVAAAAVAVVGLTFVQARFALWSTQVLSESLALTVGVLVLAAWLRVAGEPTPRRVAWAWAATLGFMVIRDAHVVPVGVVLVPVVVGVALVGRSLRPVRRRLLGGAALAVVVAGYVFVAQDVSNRNETSFHNVIGRRVLTDADLTAWFVDGGMPLDDALRARAGKVAWDDDEAFLKAPELADYRDWADGAGARRMLTSMVVRAPDWLEGFARDLPGILRYDFEDYDTAKVHQRLPLRPFGVLSGARSNRSLQVWTALALAGLVAAAIAGAVDGHRARPRAALVVAAALAFAYLDLYGSWVGDSLELSRHSLGAVQRLHLACVLGVALGVDAVVALARPRRSAEAR